MYRNNPDAVCDITIEVTQAEPELHAALRSVARRILQVSDEGASWKLATDEDITVTQLTGGITNVLFLLSLKSDGDSKVIVRLYGQGTSAFIDRTVENFVFSKLSILGIGPTFHGRFTNGRVEGYLPATALESSEMGDADVFPHIARAVAELHGLDFPEIRGTGWLWAKIQNFLRLAAEGSEGRVGDAGDLLATEMGRQLDWLEAYVAARREEGSGAAAETQSAAAGRAFGLQEALCHNDLLSGNILRAHAHARAAEEGGGASDARQVFLIDYEYAAYNYRAFDLANHFSEHCGFEYDFLRTLPSEDFMMAFARHYLGACAGWEGQEPSAEFLRGLLDAVRWLLLASHLFWGSWSLVQARCSSIDFDYAGYARRRFAAFLMHRPQYAAEQGVQASANL